jgi:hypothetical protein
MGLNVFENKIMGFSDEENNMGNCDEEIIGFVDELKVHVYTGHTPLIQN